MKQLSFKLHPLDSIIQQGNILFPGAVRVIALFYDESKNSVFQLENNLKSNTIKNVILNKQITNNFRASSNNKYWISSSELGYVESKEKIKQLSLEDELQNNSLVLKFLNEFDEKYDVLVVQFNRDKNNFELEANPQPLNTTNKSIIGHLLFNSLSASIDTHYQNRKIFEQIIKSNIGLNHNLEQTKTLLKSAQKQYIESLKNILKQY